MRSDHSRTTGSTAFVRRVLRDNLRASLYPDPQIHATNPLVAGQLPITALIRNKVHWPAGVSPSEPPRRRGPEC